MRNNVNPIPEPIAALHRTMSRINELPPKINELPPNRQRDEFMGLYVASQRAAHQILDNPKILEDPLALRIIGAEAESRLRLSLAQFQKPVMRVKRAAIVVRNRYAEDELARSIQRGVRQYVILGAGLDTFAYRNSFPLLRVFEVDHPATQARKRSYLEKAAIPIPASVTFVSVDFERQMLPDALRQSGFKSDEPTFISFIGVVRYLSREAFISLLTSIVSSMQVGSEVVFDFGPPPSLLQLFRGRAVPGRTEVVCDSSSSPSLPQRLRELAYRMIVNWKFKNNAFRTIYFNPASLTRDLKRIGFADVQLVGPKEMNMRYCKDRTDGLRIQQMYLVKEMYLVKARV
jgi:methyltransferase (TIGR00027 family)